MKGFWGEKRGRIIKGMTKEVKIQDRSIYFSILCKYSQPKLTFWV